AEGPGPGRVVEDGAHGGGQRGGVADDVVAGVVAEGLAVGGDVGHDHRPAGGYRLEHDHRERLPHRGLDDDVGGGQRRGDVLGRRVAEEGHPLGEAPGRDLRLEVGAQLPLAEHEQLDRGQVLERGEERGVVLLGGEATHRDEERPVRASARRLPPEVALGGGRVDPVVDHHRAAAGGGAVAVEGGLGDVDVVVGEAGGSQEAQDGAAGRALEVGEDVV